MTDASNGGGNRMQRPIGVTLLAIGAGLAGLLQIWRILVFAGITKWTFAGREVAFSSPQWGEIFWCAILAVIWFYVAAGFWNVRAYAWSFGTFISLFTLIWASSRSSSDRRSRPSRSRCSWRSSSSCT